MVKKSNIIIFQVIRYEEYYDYFNNFHNDITLEDAISLVKKEWRHNRFKELK